MNAATSPTGSLPRLLLSTALALLLGLVLTQQVSAAPAKGVSIGDRTQAQKDLCDVNGGTFEVETTYSKVFRGVVTKTVTTCSGGQYPQTCTNTSKDTTCSKGFVVPPQDPFDDGSIDEGQIGGVQTAPEPEVIVDNGSIGEGQIQPLSTEGSTAPAPTKSDRGQIVADFLPIDPLP